MEITITLPDTSANNHHSRIIRNEWLVPRKVRHSLRIRKNVWINQEPALFHEVHAGDHITLRFEETDYQYQEVQVLQWC